MPQEHHREQIAPTLIVKHNLLDLNWDNLPLTNQNTMISLNHEAHDCYFRTASIPKDSQLSHDSHAIY